MENNITFEQFLELIKGQLKNYLPSNYKNSTITLKKVLKEGGRILTGILLENPTMEGTQISPVLYVDNAYKDYCSGKSSLDELLTNLSLFLEESDRTITADNMTESLEWDKAKDRIVSRIVNRKINADYIADRIVTNVTPDLCLIYDISLAHISSGSCRMGINQKLMEQLGVSVSDIHAAAERNNPIINPPLVCSLSKLMRDLTDIKAEEEQNPLYIITNEAKEHGATTIFYPGVIEKIQSILGDYYLIPSSVHEWLAVSQDVTSPEELTKMIREINRNEVEKQDILDDIPYKVVNNKLIPLGISEIVA